MKSESIWFVFAGFPLLAQDWTAFGQQGVGQASATGLTPPKKLSFGTGRCTIALLLPIGLEHEVISDWIGVDILNSQHGPEKLESRIIIVSFKPNTFQRKTRDMKLECVVTRCPEIIRTTKFPAFSL
jgi:hypothetical protein